MFNYHTHFITCIEYKSFESHGSKNTTLSDINSGETNVSNGNLINIFFKNMKTKFYFQPILTKISKTSLDESKSLSSISNIIPTNNTKIPVFVKLTFNIICLKTEFL